MKFYSFLIVFLIVENSKLIHFWSFDGTLNDDIGKAHLLYGKNGTGSPDRFNRPQRSVCLNNGFLKAPDSIYFGESFSVTAWIYLKTKNLHSPRLIDFGYFTTDNVVISTGDRNSLVEVYVLDGSFETKIKSIEQLSLFEWTHLTVAFSDYIGRIFYNGRLVGFGMLNVPINITRNSNYIGKSNWAGNPNAVACYDDIKIWSHALSEIEIINDIGVISTSTRNSYSTMTHNPNQDGLVRHWSFKNNFLDEVNGASLNCKDNSSLIEDRLENWYSALLLKNGFCQMPQGVYFTGDFSITMWIKLNKAIYQMVLLDFGNPNLGNFIRLKTTVGYVEIMITEENKESSFRSDNPLKLNEWFYLAIVLEGNIGKIYLNGNLDKSGKLKSPKKFGILNSNFVGKNSLNGRNAEASFDELKIFNKALNISEIILTSSV